MRRIAMAGLVAGVSLALAACGGSGASSAPSAAASDGGSTAACEVVTTTGDVSGTMDGTAFEPTALTATVGQVVAITNQDPVAHTFTLDDGSCDTGTVTQGGSGAIRFDAAGSFPFHCTVHPSMKGTVTVS